MRIVIVLVVCFVCDLLNAQLAYDGVHDKSVCGSSVSLNSWGDEHYHVFESQLYNSTDQLVGLKHSSINAFEDSPSINAINSLVDAGTEGSNIFTIGSQVINESVSVIVNDIAAPTITSNLPICSGSDVIITITDGFPNAIVSFDIDNIPGVLELDDFGNYTIIIPNAAEGTEINLFQMNSSEGSLVLDQEFVVTVNPLPIYEEPASKELCDFNNPGDEQELFLLDIPEIIAGQNGVGYTIHELMVDAENDVNALTGDPNNPNQEISYTNTSNPQTLYIRGEDEATGCFTIMTLELRVLPIAVAIQPNNIEVCDNSTNDGVAVFDLTEVETEIFGTQNPVYFSIRYYLSQAEAETGGTAISSPETYENSVLGGETIYVRVENNGDSDCYAVTSFDITVHPSPNASFEMTASCDGATATILGDTGGVFSFYQAPTDAAVINPADGEISNVTQGATYIIAYSLDGADCSALETVSVTIGTLPNVVSPSNLQACGTVSEGVWFDLDSKISEITNQDSNLMVSFYLSQILAEAGDPTNALSSPYLATSLNQTVYVRVAGDGGCVVYTEMVLDLFETVQMAQLPEISECDNHNDGIATFNLSQIESLLGTNPNWVVTYHSTQNDAQNGSNDITNVTNYPSTSATIYVRITNAFDDNGLCITILPLDLLVNPSPEVALSEIVICESGSLGFEAFDLQAEISNILGSSQNITNFSVRFYTDSFATNEIATNPFTNTIANAQTIYLQISNLATNCSAIFPLDLQVLSGIELTEPSDLSICDGVLNDGIGTFDLTSLESDMLHNQNPDDFLISYHNLFDEAQNGTNAIANPQNYQNLNSPFEQLIYIRVQGLDTPDCISTTQVRLVVNALMRPQVFSVDGRYTICVDFGSNELQSGLTLTTNLQGANYTYQWLLNGAEISGATLGSYDITTSSPGLYSVYVVDNNSDTVCGESAFSNEFEVIQSGLASLVSVTTSQPFANNQTVTVVVQGYGDYWFQLNDGPITDNNGVFSNVLSGVHTVTVYDRRTDHPSCGFIIIDSIQIIDYPRFFTPNNDGYHDTWNITAMQDQPNSLILIYDRYGKIISSIKPNGPGWDGNYDGQLMMSNDYWFVLTYQDDDGTQREFKAHFTLKR